MAIKHSDLEITNDEFQNVIMSKTHKLVVVDFFAEWCMPCLILAPIIEDLSKNMKDVKFVKIDVDDNAELASKHKIHSIPCLVIFKDGKEVDRIIGTQSSDYIEQRINSCL